MNKNLVVIASASVGGALTGAAATYFILNRKISKKYQDIADAEIKSVKDVYLMTQKVKERNELEVENEAIRLANEEAESLPSEDSELAELKDKLVGLAYGDGVNGNHQVSYNKMSDAPRTLKTPTPSAHYVVDKDKITDTSTGVEYVVSVDELSDDVTTWPRSAEKPFVVTTQEFFEDDDDDYSRITITYWEEDDVLADEREQTIPDIDALIGHENLKHFGKGSDDENILYVRNDKIKADFEVVKDPRSYSEVVLGISKWDSRDQTDDSSPKIKKMRGDD